MKKCFPLNDNLFYVDDPNAARNTFRDRPCQTEPVPTYEEARDRLPQPFWTGREDVLACYEKTWRIAFSNLRQANPDAGFVSNFIDTAFNGYLFMWDSSFIVMFGKYGSRAFDFQRTLDNFYARQHRDGYICRELCEEAAGDQFTRDDPASTGPNIMPWAEWEYYRTTGDKERLSRVFDPLCGYHRWLMLNRSWPDGSYWSCGLACGMDNQKRLEPQYNELMSHGFMRWIDTSAQQYFSAKLLTMMARELGREDETAWLEEEKDRLASIINEKMWSEADGFYYDTYRDGRLSGIKSIAAYWTLLADLVPPERMERFVAHLDNPAEFKRPNRVPTLSADAKDYDPLGGYWNGAVWAPTNYMVLRGLTDHGYDGLAYEIARTFLDNVVEVFNKTGTVFENYQPEQAAQNSQRRDFVGWTGLAPISILFEQVFGIVPDTEHRKIVWNVHCLEYHGIRRYPLGDATVELECAARASADEKPRVTVRSDKPVTVEIRWNGRTEQLHT